VDEFASLGVKVSLATEDGTAGRRGTALDLLREHTVGGADDVVVYSSGPERMLEALARLCREEGIRGYLSLEARMACGVGVCNSCAVRVRSEEDEEGWIYKLVCRDGPVFSAERLYVP